MKYVAPKMEKMVVATVDVITSSTQPSQPPVLPPDEF